MTSSQSAVAVVDPVLDLTESVVSVVRLPPQNVSKRVSPITSPSTRQLEANIPMTALDNILARTVSIAYEAKITLEGPDSGGDHLVVFGDGNTSLRAYPLTACIESASVSFNNVSISSNPSQWRQYGLQNMSSEERLLGSSTCPTEPDPVADYPQLADFGAAGNPMNGIGSSSLSDNPSRGAFPVKVESSSATKTVVTVKVVEPLGFVQPFTFPPDRSKGLAKFDSDVNIQLLLDGNCRRMISHDRVRGNQVDSVTVEFVNAEFRTTFFTRPGDAPLPRGKLIYHYLDHTVHRSPSQQHVADETKTYEVGNLRLNQVPEALAIAVVETDETKTFESADGQLRITSAVMTWGNETGLLATLQEADLFDLSVQNGLNYSWPVCQKKGLLLIVRPADLGLSKDTIAGLAMTDNISVRVTAVNQSGRAMLMELQVVPVFQNVLNVGRSMVTLQRGFVTAADAMRAISSRRVVMARHEVASRGGWFGSHLFHDIGRAVGKVGHAIGHVARGVASDVAHTAGDIARGRILKAATGLAIGAEAGGCGPYGRCGGYLPLGGGSGAPDARPRSGRDQRRGRKRGRYVRPSDMPTSDMVIEEVTSDSEAESQDGGGAGREGDSGESRGGRLVPREELRAVVREFTG